MKIILHRKVRKYVKNKNKKINDDAKFLISIQHLIRSSIKKFDITQLL
jgi:hypothetical protein